MRRLFPQTTRKREESNVRSYFRHLRRPGQRAPHVEGCYLDVSEPHLEGDHLDLGLGLRLDDPGRSNGIDNLVSSARLAPMITTEHARG